MGTVNTSNRSVHVPPEPPRPAIAAGAASDRGAGIRRKLTLAGIAVPAVAILVLGLLTRERWLPGAVDLLRAVGPPSVESDPQGHSQAQDDHAADDQAGNVAATSLELSEQARKNIGLTLVTVQPREFQRTVTMPAVLVDRPGRAEIEVSAPMTGIITRIHPIRGEAVSPGEPLFDLRLTHEDLVEKQSELLRALEELDVVEREVARLADVTATGAIAGKRLLERQYEQQKLEAAIRAERQALVLHGLDQEQIRTIVEDRRLLQDLTITAPSAPADCASCGKHEEFLQVAEIAAKSGEYVTAGSPLCSLIDHCELYIEGRAFEQDADTLNEAANRGTPVTAIVEGNGSGKHEVPGLEILYVEDEVELESRALRFYLQLPNELVRNEQTSDGHRFIGWRYKPGQRVEVLVPVERWENQIVLPVEAVVQEGAEWYVYQQIGARFERKPVHVEYRDQQWAVIESDGTLFPGDVVAGRGAYKIHLALKNKAGGGPDAHAGHIHH